MLHNDSDFLSSVNISYDDFNNWITENTPFGSSPSDMLDLLAYVGFVHYMAICRTMPEFTLADLNHVIFGSDAVHS